MFKSVDMSQQKLYRLLRDEKTIWVLYLDIVKFQEVEFRYGYKICRQILDEIEREINHTIKQQRNLYLFSHFESRGGDDFVVYFVPGKNTCWNITGIIEQWVLPLEERFNHRIRKLVSEKISLRSGLAQCINEVGRGPDYLLYAAVKEAFLLNKSEPDPHFFARREEISLLIEEPDTYLKAAFQPIIETRSGEVFGFEALARMPGSTCFNNIADLFPFAEKIGHLYPIETLCRRQAIISFPTVAQGKEMLFLNINPQVLSDPEFASGHTRKFLNEKGLAPSDVVLEITERSAIEDFSAFRDALDHYRNQGYLIALDDVGAGYSSLQSVAELHPDFLKVDRSLIAGVNADPIKWALLETFVTFSKRIGCRIIAEGVETEEEMRTVVQLGVDYIQGFFVAKPTFMRMNINPAVMEILGLTRRLKGHDQNPIISMIEPLPLFNTHTQVNTVETYFREHPNQYLVGITDDSRLVGVVQRDRLFAALGTRYGVPLFSERTVPLIMDRNPLVVEDTTPLEVMSSIAMQRPDAQLYDGIIVANQQMPIGLVSVAKLMKAMTERQIQIARGANPLTGLPGNLSIELEIRQRLEQALTFGLIYVDLNKFKIYNDLYGFQQGDMVIKMLSEILQNEASKTTEETFVGHIGGDDFILISSMSDLENLAVPILDRFKESCKLLPGAENLSVALAGFMIDSTEQEWTPLLVSERAAQIKKEVKAIGGNSFLLR
ncbi:bifunctional diguanylate cyclase/phosphodiesterase [Desulfosporosinus sp. BICA1-9]|uniref:GGDEF domain-containing protein n=1 Tax=Desulfosporosinus sp. BICA1-9 TaxID=1531958 RepID=UPI00054B2E71|nr:bifunctional diguanylate cyclase/phosphodiesterase [Desulfosporosinus sp. BICA1-9]KJS49661.1 MAG: diguanylate cyclase [Peptococcaceae bacterium BRH_c23]KJS88452.1 MAG: diguanylate cyclase [Desulfosporosinus sp. BICA1-9]HBW34705.1 GGDEF domain-containing protein [Desulfosporosinus sp.]